MAWRRKGKVDIALRELKGMAEMTANENQSCRKVKKKKTVFKKNTHTHTKKYYRKDFICDLFYFILF